MSKKFYGFEVKEFDVTNQKYLPSKVIHMDNEQGMDTLNSKRRTDLDFETIEPVKAVKKTKAITKKKAKK